MTSKIKHILSNIDTKKRIAFCSFCCRSVLIHKNGIRWACRERVRSNHEKYVKTEKYIIARKTTRRYSNTKGAAKTRGKLFLLSRSEYENIVNKPCYYCDNKLGKSVEFASGLDRLDNSVGYTIDNVVSCCTICNRIKGEFLTPEETIVAVKAVLHYREENNGSN